jgi:PncC family amidohydrolase
MLTDASGASSFFNRGWVTYTDDSKTDELGVPRELIEQHGAVSEQVACAMAEGAMRRAATDYAIGITGIAGPTGATEHKPVGLVYMTVCSAEGCTTTHGVFSHGRGAVRFRASLTALNMLRLKLNA